jgi:hypothetical protein
MEEEALNQTSQNQPPTPNEEHNGALKSFTAWWKRRNTPVKVVIVLGALVVTGAAIGSVQPNSQKGTSTTTTVSAVVTGAATATTTTVSADPVDRLKALVGDVLPGDNNMDRPMLRKVAVVKQVDGGYGVFVEMNASDNLTKGFIKGGIEETMSEVYMALYQSGLDVRTATVAAFFPLTDKYGKESEGCVYESALDKTEADKVNWRADETMLMLDILPGIWDTTLLNVSLR